MRLKVLFIVGSIFCISCAKQDLSTEEKAVTILGHGGMGINYVANLNSWGSIKAASETKADGIELDAQLTADGKLVAYHDEQLEEQTKCEGTVYEKTANELSECVYQGVFQDDDGIVSLERVVAEVVNPKNLVLSIDCKLYNSNTETIEKFATAIISLQDKFKNKGNFYCESTSGILLERIKDLGFLGPLFFYAPSAKVGLEVAKRYDLSGISLDFNKITKDEMSQLKGEGFLVMVWSTSNRNDQIEALEKKPDIIQTDRLKQLLRITDRN